MKKALTQFLGSNPREWHAAFLSVATSEIPLAVCDLAPKPNYLDCRSRLRLLSITHSRLARGAQLDSQLRHPSRRNSVTSVVMTRLSVAASEPLIRPHPVSALAARHVRRERGTQVASKLSLRLSKRCFQLKGDSPQMKAISFALINHFRVK